MAIRLEHSGYQVEHPIGCADVALFNGGLLHQHTISESLYVQNAPRSGGYLLPSDKLSDAQSSGYKMVA